MGDEPNLNNEQELRDAITEARNKQFEEQQEQKAPVIEEGEEEAAQEVDEVKEEKPEEAAELEEVGEVEEEEQFVDEKAKGKAFQKLRLEKKQAKEESAALRERIARLEGMQEVQDKRKEEVAEDAEPDKEEDYEAHQEWRIRQQDNKIASLEAKQIKTDQLSQFQEAEKVWHDVEKSHIQDDESYGDAKEFLIKTLTSEASAKFPSATVSQIKDYVRNEELKFVGSLAEQGIGEGHIIATMRSLSEQKGFKPAAKKVPQDKEKLKRNMSKSVNLADAPSAGSTNETPLKHFMKQSNAGLMSSAHNPMEAAKMQKALRKARLALATG